MINQLSETDLIGKIVQGETALYEVLIRRNNPHLYKVGRSFGFRHEDVEDLMQEAFVNAYTSLSQFEGRSLFKTWIIRIMYNECHRRLRKFSFKNEVQTENTMKEDVAPLFQKADGSDTQQKVLTRELNGVIEAALLKLPVEQRTVFSLRELNGLSVAETSEIMNISQVNVRVRLNRARQMLRKEIEKIYSAEDIFEFNLVYCDGIVDRVMQRIAGMTERP